MNTHNPNKAMKFLGRPSGVFKDPNRPRIKNPNGRIIDINGPQYKKLIKNGYLHNEDNTHLILNPNFIPPDKIKNIRTGRMILKTSQTFRNLLKNGYRLNNKGNKLKIDKKYIPPIKVKNPDSNRMINKNSQTFKKLIRKYKYDENENKFVTHIVDPKSERNIDMNDKTFKKRIKHGYIYDENKNKLIIPSSISDSAFNKSVKTYDLTLVDNDPIVQFNKLQKRIHFLIKQNLIKNKATKINIGMDINFLKGDVDKMIINTFYVSSKAIDINNKTEIKKVMRTQLNQINDKIDRFTNKGSGWSVDEITRHYLTIWPHTPLSARTYIPLPSWIQNKKATINIKNNDDKCFIYCIARAIDPNPEKRDLERISKHLKKVCQDLRLNEIETPVSIKSIPEIENKYNVTINIFGHSNNKTDFYPIRITKNHFEKHVNLLYTEKEDKQHYVLIKDFNKLNNKITKNTRKKYFCYYCLQHFTREDILNKHKEDCIEINGTQAIKMPEIEKSNIKFYNIQNIIPVPFVIYADIEAIHKITAKSTTHTEYKDEHVASSIAYKVVCHEDNNYSKPVKVISGKHCIEEFLKSLILEETEILKLMKMFTKSDIIMTKQQYEEYRNAKVCYICKKNFSNTKEYRKVRDHNHITGKYRGAAHDQCNLKLKLSYKIPVIFHNLKGYDSHHIMQVIGKLTKKINVIPNNMEKYLAFTFGTERKAYDKKKKQFVTKTKSNLTFIDSFQFMNTSLEKLVVNLSDNIENFQHTKNEFGDDFQWMIRKGVYPYKYITSFKKFQENPLTLKLKDFKNDLTGENISQENYKYFLDICNKFQIKTLGEYEKLYLKSDVTLLSDVFEHFRKTCLNYYGLDPCHYLSSPGLAWDACLKKTGITLELLTDIDMYNFIEKGLRGGISIVAHRKGESNNKFMDNFDKEKNQKFISYVDVINLYGFAMLQNMPYSGFRWINPEEYNLQEYEKLCNDNLNVGHILEVDLEYPEELHDLHNEYPFCPEHLKITEDMLSKYSKNIANKFKIKCSNISKLTQTLNNKIKYVIHERSLRQAIDNGLKITKIHRILQFNQKPWMKPYIEFNTEKRKIAKNDFEKDFFKLMNNSVFGKTMENLRKRQNIKLATDEKYLKKYCSKPIFIGGKIFNENLVAMHLIKEKLVLNKPVYVGFCILDISKTLMYDFHYNHMKRNYNNRAKLLYTDTDSFIYEVETKNIYRDMQQHKEWFDLSEINKKEFCDSSNKKVIGKFKPEYPNEIITNFIGLRSKLYNFVTQSGTECSKAKGITKSVIRKKLKHKNYVKTLEEAKQLRSKMTVIRSLKHKIYTQEINKISLSSYDDKRYILDDGISSYAYGHYKIH